MEYPSGLDLSAQEVKLILAYRSSPLVIKEKRRTVRRKERRGRNPWLSAGHPERRQLVDRRSNGSGAAV